MEKILFDDSGNKYKVEEFDKLINGGFISKLKEEKVVEKVNPDKLFITRDDFGVDFYYKDGERGTVCDNIDMEYDLFVKLLSNGGAYPSYELCEEEEYDNDLSCRLNRFKLYCSLKLRDNKNHEGHIVNIIVVWNNGTMSASLEESYMKIDGDVISMRVAAYENDSEDIINKFKDGWY